jgi:hypothetical protein
LTSILDEYEEGICYLRYVSDELTKIVEDPSSYGASPAECEELADMLALAMEKCVNPPFLRELTHSAAEYEDLVKRALAMNDQSRLQLGSAVLHKRI